MSERVGILSLQGDYEKHGQILSGLGIEPVFVRYAKQLDKIDGLVIPGGESTTMTRLLSQDLHRQVKEFCSYHPVLGTCAGLIMLAAEVDDPRVKPLSLLNIAVERNGYGRQVESFTDNLEVELNTETLIIPATFIRAPRIISWGEDVNVLASLNGEPVVVSSGHILGMSFHPELDGIDLFHRQLFLNESVRQEPFLSKQLHVN